MIGCMGAEHVYPRPGIFEQMTSLDEVEMNISWQLITHPQNANLWPYSFLNNTTHVKVGRMIAHEAAHEAAPCGACSVLPC